jgi:hypothetical protein
MAGMRLHRACQSQLPARHFIALIPRILLIPQSHEKEKKSTLPQEQNRHGFRCTFLEG